MKNNTKYLVTAALPYANNYIHIGHVAGAYLSPDIYVRYRKLKNDDVIFISGSDEHGTAIEMASIIEKITPQEIILPIIDKNLNIPQSNNNISSITS